MHLSTWTETPFLSQVLYLFLTLSCRNINSDPGIRASSIRASPWAPTTISSSSIKQRPVKGTASGKTPPENHVRHHRRPRQPPPHRRSPSLPLWHHESVPIVPTLGLRLRVKVRPKPRRSTWSRGGRNTLRLARSPSFLRCSLRVVGAPFLALIIYVVSHGTKGGEACCFWQPLYPTFVFFLVTLGCDFQPAYQLLPSNPACLQFLSISLHTRC